MILYLNRHSHLLPRFDHIIIGGGGGFIHVYGTIEREALLLRLQKVKLNRTMFPYYASSLTHITFSSLPRFIE